MGRLSFRPMARVVFGVSGVEFEMVKTTPFVNRNRNHPARGKKPDDEIAEHTEVVVEFVDQDPKASLQVELAGQKS